MSQQLLIEAYPTIFRKFFVATEAMNTEKTGTLETSDSPILMNVADDVRSTSYLLKRARNREIVTSM